MDQVVLLEQMVIQEIIERFTGEILLRTIYGRDKGMDDEGNHRVGSRESKEGSSGEVDENEEGDGAEQVP